MQFRPCIDIHNGKVKQIVGKSLRDEDDSAAENFVSEKNADDYAKLYQKYNLKGGHVILLNSKDSPYYELTKKQAFMALAAYPQGLQAGGGITAENAAQFLDAGASHVIVTSYVFQGGRIQEEHLEKLIKTVGKERLVLDVSCRRKEDGYYIVTDRWQRVTGIKITEKLLDELSSSCSEFLIHAVDVEGRESGIEEKLVKELASWLEKREESGSVITYAGGVRNLDDLKKLKTLGKDEIHVTIGSALDIFGGKMRFEEAAEFCREHKA